MKAQAGSLFVRRLMSFAILSALLTSPITSHALTILSGPTFTAAGVNAPLAGTLQITTDVPSRLTVSVDDGTNAWERIFYDYATVRSMPLLGFKPNRTNQMTFTVQDKNGVEVASPQHLTFVTAALPSDFPTIVLLQSNPERMEPGYTLLRGVNNGTGRGYLMIVDSAAEVVWYSGATSTLDVRQLWNGDLFVPLLNSFYEMNMVGQTVRTWVLPSGKPYNHEAYPTEHGTILYMSDASEVITGFPSSATNPNAPKITTNLWHQPVVEISTTNAALLNTWLPVNMLDPRRISYLTFTSPASAQYGVDWGHANAITESPSDNSLIVSLRTQNAVIKFSRATGQLKWILGTPDNWGPQWQPYLLTPVGTPFEWQFGQHAPKITPRGTLLLFDDGNYRASPFVSTPVPDPSNYSRAVEYQINETNMTVSQVWEYGAAPAPSIYSVSRGDAEWLNQRTNVLITFADTAYVGGVPPDPFATNAHIVRVQEVTHEASPQILFDFALFDYGNPNVAYKGYAAYRSNRIRDLYPPKPVTDLAVDINNSQANLTFSGDEVRLYTVQASTDMVAWANLGTASSDGSGNFTFVDNLAGGSSNHYYRVQTQ
ncbi:MAG: Arylsulfotransferase [Pedosphaera sp.]|nr:Arylsulfotransferase [Pedosphaera sp.]